MEGVGINIDVSRGHTLPNDLCTRFHVDALFALSPTAEDGTGDMVKPGEKPSGVRLLGHREEAETVEDIRTLIEAAVPGI